MIPPSGAECFEALYFGFYVVCLQVEMHAFLGDLLVAGLLQKDADVGVRKPQFPVHLAAAVRHLVLGCSECRCPERRGLVEVSNVDDEVADAATVHWRTASLCRLGAV